MKKFALAFVIVFITAVNVSGQAGVTRTYSTKHGLPSNRISCVIQDSDGFIWIGTDNGVCRFDGRNNRVFRKSNGNLYHIQDNCIFSLMEDQRGNIWAGTLNGVYVCRDGLNFEHFDVTTRYGVFPSCEVTGMIQTLSGEIWMGTLGQGLFIYDPDKGTLRQDNVHVSFVYNICEFGNSIYLSTMSEGVVRYTVGGTFLDCLKKEDGSVLIDDIPYLTIGNRNLWAGSVNGEIYRMDPTSRALTKVVSVSEGGMTLRGLFAEAERRLLMIVTDKGLYRLSYDGVKMVPLNVWSHALQDAVVRQATLDSEGGLWLATENSGVIYMSRRNKPFHTVDGKDLHVVNAFCEDGNHRIWIGGKNGLFYKEPRSFQVKAFPLEVKECEIKSMCLHGGYLWLGTNGRGIIVLDPRSGKVKRRFVHEKDKPYSLCDNRVTSLCPRSNGDIYVGTGCGFCYYNPEKDNFYTFTSLSFTINVTDIKEDSEANLWMSTSNSGLYVLYHDSFDFVHYASEPLNDKYPPATNVLCIYPEKNGRTWFGTAGMGLFHYDADEGVFRRFKDHDSWMSSRIVYSIAVDGNGYLCMSSDAGFVRLSEYGEMDYHVMSADDGLTGGQFNNGAALAASDGMFYFGESNGFDILNPVLFERNDYVPQVYISDVRLTDMDSETDTFNVFGLKSALYRSKEITVPYRFNSLAFSFSSLSYQDPKKNRFSYKMVGVDPNWINNMESEVAVYRNLPPGKYLLMLKGSNNDSVWNENTTSLSVKILPPWWKSKVAKAFYLFLIIFSLVAVTMLLRRRSKRAYQQLEDNLNAKKEKDIYISKIQFFTQIVHEIRTPLTLIKLPVEALKERLGDSNTECQSIDRNVNYLLGVVNELLDMQKIENGEIQLQVIQMDIVECVRECCKQFSEAFANKGIAFPVNLPDVPVMATVDPVKVSKIIVNLLGNALKYAKTEVEVTLSADSANILLRIEDDGPGVAEENKEKIFQAFFQEDNEKSSLGTGIGLTYARRIAECHRGGLSVERSHLGGAAFVLTLPCLVRQEFPTVIHDQAADTVTSLSTATSAKYSVLIVEDNEELLDMMAGKLKKWYAVSTATNGLSALDVLSSQNIDMVVSDVMMPEMSGVELCKRIKADINYSHVPVILLTAKIQLQAKLEGMEAGANVYMEKPFTIDQLHMQIENLFSLRISFHRWVEKEMSSLHQEGVAVDTAEDHISAYDRQFILKMNDVIDRNISREEFSIEQLSMELGMSKSSFYRKLHTLSDMTPNDYLKNYRLNRASAMLMDGLRASEVYSEVGFSSASYFSKCFKRKFGLLPKEFQMSHNIR